jgi:hypothetical protein
MPKYSLSPINREWGEMEVGSDIFLTILVPGEGDPVAVVLDTELARLFT